MQKRKRVQLDDEDLAPNPVMMFEPPIDKRQSNYHLPTPYSRRQVALLCAYRIDQRTIAHIMNITTNTLQSHYRQELDLGPAIATARVAERLYNDAVNLPGTAGIEAAKFWLARNAGWKENNSLALTDPNGQPLGSALGAQKFTNEERAIRIAQLLNAARVGGDRSTLDDSEGTMVTQPRSPD